MVSEYKNNTIFNETEYSDDNCSVKTNFCITSNDGAVVWNLNPFQNYNRLGNTNLIKYIPGVIRYATSRIVDIQSSFKVIFNPSLKNVIIQ